MIVEPHCGVWDSTDFRTRPDGVRIALIILEVDEEFYNRQYGSIKFHVVLKIQEPGKHDCNCKTLLKTEMKCRK